MQINFLSFLNHSCESAAQVEGKFFFGQCKEPTRTKLIVTDMRVLL